MSEMRPGFIRITRDDGRQALIRADAITSILENSTKGGKAVLSIQLGPVLSIHTEMTEEAILDRMSQASGLGRITVVPAAREVVADLEPA